MKYIRLIIILIVSLSVVACNVNTMYNARNYYKSAQNRPLNSNGKPSVQAVDDYTKAIKKCGIIISERKKGSQLDDAVFLMAKALYYKGNSAFQAKDQFNNLINGFPDSPFVPESHLFLARIMRELNQPKDAERKLEEFITNPRFRKDHPKALLLMTDFAIQDKDYIKAQYWLERIIRDYSKTKEFRQAYFLFGKNYYEQKNYKASLEAFEKMEGSRGIDKAMKLDTRYYIALNQLELGALDKAWRSTSSLLRAETRPEKLPTIRLLKVRILFAKGETADAEKEIQDITKLYPRTESSAAAYYYLAEHQYYTLGNHALAAGTYSRVRSEFPSTPFATISQSKAAAVNNVAPRANLNSETGLKQFLDYHYQAAESFLSQLSQPDSAIAIYRKVVAQRDTLDAKRQILQSQIDERTNAIDSLRIAIVMERSKSMADSIIYVEPEVSDSLYYAPDSLDLYIDEADSLEHSSDNESDSLSVSGFEYMQTTEEDQELHAWFEDAVVDIDSTSIAPDSIMIATSEQEEDSIVAEFEDEADTKDEPIDSEAVVAMQQEIIAIESQIRDIRNKIKSLNDIIMQFDTEIVPFCLFAIGSVLKDKYPDSPENSHIIVTMQTDFPENKYTRALRALQSGQPVRIIDPLEEREEARLDSLFGMIESNPEQAVSGLEEMRSSGYSRLKLAATFRLGWYYSFEAVDTTRAKPYLKEVMETSGAGDYITLTRRFYDGRKFLLRDIPKADSISVTPLPTLPDSLMSTQAKSESDSLDTEIEQQESEPDTEPLTKPDSPPTEPSPIIKDEEAPLE